MFFLLIVFVFVFRAGEEFEGLTEVLVSLFVLGKDENYFCLLEIHPSLI